MTMMALRRAIGSVALHSAAYLRRATTITTPLPPPPARRPLPVPTLCRSASGQEEHDSKEDEDDGPQINNDTTAPFLRLVTDQGHSVVPRHEALQLAARMDMDLVEVHRKSDPPVCKIMDFHKEKYKKDMKEKERLKTKAKRELEKSYVS